MATPDGRPGALAGNPSAESDPGEQPDTPALQRPGGWKFVASWIAFAITLLLTLWLGVEVVLGTRGFG
ncbi:MAG: hypothetical protein OXP09_02495 [Gammaproteobacteria bacterium]|nr:hypothetical protein [Gammaproteobacteria bacterium]MDE0364423.1 hypothetical protein [Gammaproteobacteria bacterium]